MRYFGRGLSNDCLIFNFVATNTIESRVLQRLLEKLQEIRTHSTMTRFSMSSARCCPRRTWSES
jgi:SNF2 family DNA or RNA helicase